MKNLPILKFRHCQVFAVFLLSVFFVHAQSPLVKQWDYRYGGSSTEYPSMFVETPDHGFLIGGSSQSNTGFEKGANAVGSDDYWIIKTDSNGIKQWDKTIGGTSPDYLRNVILLSDSGFLLTGYSKSGIGGDKTEPNRGTNFTPDYWIVRTDKNGAILWDKTYGGDNYDVSHSAIQLDDGTFMICGYTQSDSSGDFTHNNYGVYDYWILRLDANGNKLWDKTYGYEIGNGKRI